MCKISPVSRSLANNNCALVIFRMTEESRNFACFLASLLKFVQKSHEHAAAAVVIGACALKD